MNKEVREILNMRCKLVVLEYAHIFMNGKKFMKQKVYPG
jgi:hypothetical protein